MRFGLCCLFKNEEIAFRTTTKVFSLMPGGEQLKKLSGICHSNTQSLFRAVQTVHRLGLGDFCVMSSLFPRMTHVGGVYGDKAQALMRFCQVFADLPENVRDRLTLENDDISYTVSDLLSVCEKLSIPLVYDIQHHRCKLNDLSVEEATELAGATWQNFGREQYCHLSSPRVGCCGNDPKPHADYLNPEDVPICWRERIMAVDIETKAKDLAVVRLMNDLKKGDC